MAKKVRIEKFDSTFSHIEERIKIQKSGEVVINGPASKMIGAKSKLKVSFYKDTTADEWLIGLDPDSGFDLQRTSHEAWSTSFYAPQVTKFIVAKGLNEQEFDLVDGELEALGYPLYKLVAK